LSLQRVALRVVELRRSEIPKTNFRGIELRDFPAEIAARVNVFETPRSIIY